MKIEKQVITPQAARDLLKNNTQNRRVRQSHVDYLAAEMANGNWRLTAETIALAPSGVVVDGQHRLLAVVQSGASVEFWVARGVPLETQDVVDLGVTRSVGDQLHLSDGTPNAQVVASVCRSITSICCYYQNLKLSVAQTRHIYENFKGEIYSAIALLRPFKPAFRTWIIGNLAFSAKASPSLIDFIKEVGAGENIKQGDPAYAVRAWLTNGNSQNLGSSYKRFSHECLANAASAFLSGRAYTLPKSGKHGMDTFLQKNRAIVEQVRSEMGQQLKG